MNLKRAGATSLESRAESRRIRVVCVDDSLDVARGLCHLISGQPDLENAGIIDSPEGLIDAIEVLGPDIVILDLTMPGLSPLGTIRALASRVPSCRVIVYSGHDDPDTAEAVRRARKLARKKLQREGLLPMKPKVIPGAGGPGGRDGGRGPRPGGGSGSLPAPGSRAGYREQPPTFEPAPFKARKHV